MTTEPAFNVKARADFMMRFSQRDFDPFKDAYIPHLLELNRIVERSRVPLEGNIFYAHLEENLSTDNFSAPYLPKRRSLALLGLMKSSILEIGFNAGFSALLMLTANPQLRLTCIDMCAHPYTKPCYDYMRSVYGDRIRLYEGNSLEVLPLLNARKDEFDAFIIDGGHSIAVAESDLFNIIAFSRRGSLICFDDSDFPQLRVMLNMHMLTGNLISVADHIGFLGNVNQMFFLNNKP